MENPFRILCAIDASRPAAAAFEQALAMSARRGAQLVLVHAVSKDRRYSWGAVERMSALAALRERAEAQNVSCGSAFNRATLRASFCCTQELTPLISSCSAPMSRLASHVSNSGRSPIAL